MRSAPAAPNPPPPPANVINPLELELSLLVPEAHGAGGGGAGELNSKKKLKAQAVSQDFMQIHRGDGCSTKGAQAVPQGGGIPLLGGGGPPNHKIGFFRQDR